MKSNKSKLTAYLAAIILLSSCYKDNYEEPNANFHGRVIDVSTGKTFQTEQPNGFRIRFTEVSWDPGAAPQFFWAMPDGNFNWDYLFAYEGPKYEGSAYGVATYEVQPIEGAFITPDPKIIEVRPGESVTVDFEVIPCLHIEETHSLNDNELTVNLVVKRPEGSDTSQPLNGARIFISDQTKFVGFHNVGGFVDQLSPQINLTEEDLGKTISQTITLASGRVYWMRVGARTANNANRFNYTEVIEIRVP